MSDQPLQAGRSKDGWDKMQIILGPVGGLLTALAVAYLTFSTSKRLNEWQDAENNSRVYTELMGKREEAETSLRKAMFDSIMQAFLASSESGSSGAQKSLGAAVLKMELLAYNFHESLNLTPLFKDLERDIALRLQANPSDAEASDYRDRLRKVAEDIVEKQMAALRNPDGKNMDQIVTGTFQKPPDGERIRRIFVLGHVTHEITLVVTKKDATVEELKVSLDVFTTDSRLPADAQPYSPTHAEFSIGSFEFPMIDNTRLPGDQFCALVLRVFKPDPETGDVSYEVDGVCYPGSRAALQERPYYEDIIDKLRQKPQ